MKKNENMINTKYINVKFYENIFLMKNYITPLFSLRYIYIQISLLQFYCIPYIINRIACMILKYSKKAYRTCPYEM